MRPTPGRPGAHSLVDAVGSGDHPHGRDDRAPTQVVALELEAGLPRPLRERGHVSTHDARAVAHSQTAGCRDRTGFRVDPTELSGETVSQPQNPPPPSLASCALPELTAEKESREGRGGSRSRRCGGAVGRTPPRGARDPGMTTAHRGGHGSPASTALPSVMQAACTGLTSPDPTPWGEPSPGPEAKSLGH